ncbi:MAG: PilZ domain-containing protein [Bdellovibrionota bacterium]
MTKKPVSNNQMAKRFQTQEPVRVEVLFKKEVLYGRMRNLSSTGAYFEITNSTYSPKKGDLVRVTINLKKINASHTLSGEVIWSKGSGIGISFTKPKEFSKKK